jgi:hypothetical protein
MLTLPPFANKINIMTAINEKTTITIGLVIALLGGSGFLTSLWSDTQANTKTIHELKSDIKDDLQGIKADVKENNKLLVEFLATQAKLKK